MTTEKTQAKIRAERQDDGTYKVWIGNRYVREGLTFEEARSFVDKLHETGYSWFSHERAGSRAAQRRLRQRAKAQAKLPDNWTDGIPLEPRKRSEEELADDEYFKSGTRYPGQ